METEREIRRRTGGGNLGILPPVTTTLTDSISGDAGADLAAASDEYDRNFAARELGYRNQNHMDYYSRKLGAEGLENPDYPFGYGGTSLMDARRIAFDEENIGSQNVSPLGKFSAAPSFSGGFGGRGPDSYMSRVAALPGGGKFGGGFGPRRPAPSGVVSQDQHQSPGVNTTDPSRSDYMQDPNQGFPTQTPGAPPTLGNIIKNQQETGPEPLLGASASFRPRYNTSNDLEGRYGSRPGEYQV